MPTHSLFELLIQSTTIEGEYRLVAVWSPSEGLPIRRERSFRLDDVMLDAMGDAARYGAMLGHTLFTDGVRELFAQARHADPMLRVLLAVEAKGVQSLRWERLAGPFDDDQWQLLGHSQRTPFSLYLPSASDRMFSPFGRRELRALVVVANPEPGNQYGVEPFDEAEAARCALAGLGEIPSVVLGKQPGAAGPPTLSELCRRLTAERFTLLHMVCHGAFSPRTGETALFLDGDDGKTEAVKATAMIQRLRELGGARGLPHLAFLGVCDSARPDAEAALGGLGQRLVRELGMPAVVAMTERVSQATAFALGQVLYTRLREHGEVDRALVEACVEVRDQGDAVVPALFSRLAGRPLFHDELDRPPSHDDLVAATGRIDALFRERAPVLRERAMSLATAVSVDPAALAGVAAAARQAQLAELEQLCEGALELSFSALAHGREPPPYGVRCPFPGLRAFTSEQRKFFRGRTALVDVLLGQLEREPFLAVVGSSGCGKSSLVLAGVIPRLQDADPALRVARLEPGDHPLPRLEAALEELAGAASGLVYVDQLEEAFTLCRDEQERRAFFDRLDAIPSPQRTLIVSMRSDFLEDARRHEGLRKRLERRHEIPMMSAEALRDTIEEQSREAGLRCEIGLCELVFEDVMGEPGAIPLVQHLLRELYEHRHGRWLRLAAYHELGRVRGALGRTAEMVWSKLDRSNREGLRMVLLYLTEVNESEYGVVRYLRRRVPLEQLYAATSATPQLVDVLADERLLVKGQDEAGCTSVELAHETLLHGWDRLHAWLMMGLEGLRLRQELESAAAAWRKHGGSRAWLVHLFERRELVEMFVKGKSLMLDAGLQEYLQACAEAERSRRDGEPSSPSDEPQRTQQLAMMQALAAGTTALVGMTRALMTLEGLQPERRSEPIERAAEQVRHAAEQVEQAAAAALRAFEGTGGR